MHRLNNVFSRSSSPFRRQARRCHATYTYQRYRHNYNAGDHGAGSDGSKNHKNDTYENIRYNLDRIVAVPFLGQAHEEEEKEDHETDWQENSGTESVDRKRRPNPTATIPYISIPFNRDTFSHMQEITNKDKYKVI